MTANNRYLLDSHVFVWLLNEKEKLPRSVLATIQSPETLVSISFVSLWELRIKQSARKLPLPDDFYKKPIQFGLEIVPLAIRHIEQVGSLPFHHHDPFDRMLIAQAQCERMTLISSDRHFAKYQVDLLQA